VNGSVVDSSAGGFIALWVGCRSQLKRAAMSPLTAAR
jgi:hypothetical protein